MKPIIIPAKALITLGAFAAAAWFDQGITAEATITAPEPPTGQPTRPSSTRRAFDEKLDRRISIDLQDASFEDAVTLLRKRCDLTIVLAPDVVAAPGELVTLKADDQCVRVVLDDFIKNTGLHYLLREPALYLSREPLRSQAGHIIGDEGLEGELSRQLDQRITLDLQDGDFYEAIRQIRSRSRLTMILSPALVAAPDHRQVSVKATDLRIRDVLDDVTRQVGAHYSIQNQALYFDKE